MYDTIFTVEESPLEKGVIWAGTDDGLVQVTRDGGKNWQNVTPKGIPEWIRINSLDRLAARQGDLAYIAATMYKFDDFRPYLYKTADYGKTWTKIVNGIPDERFHSRDPRGPGPARACSTPGRRSALYVSFDDGANWQPFQLNLPVVPITDLAVKDGDLVVATQGRAFWIARRPDSRPRVQDSHPRREDPRLQAAARGALSRRRFRRRRRGGGSGGALGQEPSQRRRSSATP